MLFNFCYVAVIFYEPNYFKYHVMVCCFMIDGHNLFHDAQNVKFNITRKI